jgi:hypothetical protein
LRACAGIELALALQLRQLALARGGDAAAMNSRLALRGSVLVERLWVAAAKRRFHD